MSHQSNISSEWREESLAPFDELILSWNGKRPEQGNLLFYVRVKTDDWSPWLLYAAWGAEGQSSFEESSEAGNVKTFQDAIEVLNNKKATAFAVKIASEGNASLSNLHALHAYTNGQSEKPTQVLLDHKPVHLKVPGLSQIALQHQRCRDMCSPTSTTAVVRYLSNQKDIDPLIFAKQSMDHGFDIYGNWVFNVAQASCELGSKWNCWVERLKGFDDVYSQLLQGNPVVVSVRGPLKGSAALYAKGHLMAVIGYQPLENKVTCMDPAFPSDQETMVEYDLEDFMLAWNRRGKIAYVFTTKQPQA